MQSLVLHPFLFGLYPTLSYLQGIMAEADLIDAFPLIAVVLAFVVAILCVAQFVLRDAHRSGVIASGVLIFLFSPFHIFLSLRDSVFAPASISISELPVYGAIAVSMVLYVYFFAKNRRPLNRLTGILNVVSLCLVSMTLGGIFFAKLTERVDWAGIQQRQMAEAPHSKFAPSDKLPDIYYIVMDRYGAADTLQSIYHFDNRDFLDFLRSKDFFVAVHSAANYPTTTQSLASSLNFQHIDYLRAFVEERSASWIPIQTLLQNHKTGAFLKGKGYRYIHLGSWWEPTRKNKLADENVYFTPLPEKFYVLYNTTLMKPASAALGLLDLRYEHWRGNRRQFENLASTIEIPGPKFVFAHFLLPHEPYVFGRDGEYLPEHQILRQPEEISYIDQLVYANRMLRKTIDQLLSRSKRPPIVILQGDEGPWPGRYGDDYRKFDWQRATDAEVNQKMKILNALYMPGVESGALYPAVSPVNTFRIVFNLYFGTNLPPLEDQSFMFKKTYHPYDLSNITSRLSGRR